MFATKELGKFAITSLFWHFGQIPDLEEEVAIGFEGPQFFIALISGIFLAFAFQALLTNLGIAAGITLAGRKSSRSSRPEQVPVRETDEGLRVEERGKSRQGNPLKKVSLALGLGTLITITLALFFACLLAIKLSLLTYAGLGAILGLVIWAVYFALLIWFSSNAVNSLLGSLGSVINSATSGVQTLLGTITAALGAQAAKRQTVATAEAAAAAVRRELTAGIDPQGLREQLEDYLNSFRPPQLDLKGIRSEVEGILSDPSLQAAVASGNLGSISRQTFADLLSHRSDLSKRDVERVAGLLERAWQQAVSRLQPQRNPLNELVDYIKSASVEDLLGPGLNRKLDEVISELRLRRQSQSQGQQGPLQRALVMGFNHAVGMLMGRTDLSNLDVERILAQIQKIRDQLSEQQEKVSTKLLAPSEPPSVLRAEVESYLANAHLWQLEPDVLRREFRDVLYDPQADPGTVERDVERLNRADFVDWLQQKGLLTQREIRELADLLEDIRSEVLKTAREAQERERTMELLAAVEDYILNTPKADLTPEKIDLNFKPILEDPDADYAQLVNRLSQVDRPTIERLLDQRGDLSVEEKAQAILYLEQTRDRARRESQENLAAARMKAEAQWRRLQAYLRETGREELNPRTIEQELRLILEDPQAGLSAIRERVAHFDRDTLVALLSQRRDLSEDQVNAILDQVEGSWVRVRHRQEQLTGKAKEQYDRAMAAIADYLRRTGREELSPEGIRRDLEQLLSDPRTGLQAIRTRLARVDRETLVRLLSQRGDLSQEQIEATINQVQATLRDLARMPRRFAVRTQERVQNFPHALADYLRSTDREELNPQGIRRDIKLLLNDPRAGVESLRDRLAHFDRETLVALLSQREDISEADVNRIVDRILAVRDEILAQIEQVKLRAQSVVERILERIRDYLDSLERPELNYEGIRQDLRTLLDDPKAGFEALRLRLSQVNRDTLVAILSSRDDISQEDASHMIGQIEAMRDRILQRAERLQHQTQERLEAVKQQAQQQVEETRKAAAVAAWWLFATALISGMASAGAGALAVLD